MNYVHYRDFSGEVSSREHTLRKVCARLQDLHASLMVVVLFEVTHSATIVAYEYDDKGNKSKGTLILPKEVSFYLTDDRNGVCSLRFGLVGQKGEQYFLVGHTKGPFPTFFVDDAALSLTASRDLSTFAIEVRGLGKLSNHLLSCRYDAETLRYLMEQAEKSLEQKQILTR